MHEWHPDLVFKDPEPGRIYGDNQGELFALVSPEDYQWAIQWLWLPKFSRGGRKFYLCRKVEEKFQEVGFNPYTGRRERIRVQRTLFLHTAIMLRKGDEPPCHDHTLVDHLDGDSMNCQRPNLRWATPAMNRANLYGRDSHA